MFRTAHPCGTPRAAANSSRTHAVRVGYRDAGLRRGRVCKRLYVRRREFGTGLVIGGDTMCR